MQSSTTSAATLSPTPVASTSNGAASSMAHLEPVTTSTGFVFPSVYSFPPFFTKQRNATTLNAQLSQWTSLVLEYCQHHRIYRIDLGGTTLGHELWHNSKINRKTEASFQLDILKHMVSSGLAMWDPPLTSRQLATSAPAGAFIYYRKPEEWGETIYHWVAENGLIGSILTLYELTTGGDLAPSAEFYELPPPVLKLALAHLQKTGRAQTFKGTDADGDGVKFF